MEKHNCSRRDHTYCRSPDDKTVNEFSREPHCSKYIDNCVNGSDSPSNCAIKLKNEDQNGENENLEATNLEKLRLASDEANLQLERFYKFDDDDITDEMAFLPSPKLAEGSRSSISAPMQISRNPHLSAFVPWKRTKIVTNDSIPVNEQENTDNQCERDEVAIFGEYVSSEVRNVKSKFHRALLMKKIQDAVFEVKMMLLKDNDCDKPDSSNFKSNSH